MGEMRRALSELGRFTFFSINFIFSRVLLYFYFRTWLALSLTYTDVEAYVHTLSTPTYPLPDLPFSPGISLAQQLAQLDQPAPVGQLNCCAKFFLINLIFCARGQILTRKI